MRTKRLVLNILVIMLMGCSEDTFLEISQHTNQSKVSTRTAGDGIYDVLGYGYDITGEYLGEKSTRLKVLDIASFVNDNKDRFDNPFVGVIDQRCYAGEDAQSFIRQVINDSNFSGSVANINKGGKRNENNSTSGFFSATINVGFKSDTQYSYSTKYSFARAEILKKQRQYLLNTDIKTLSKYLSPAFKEDLIKYSADKIVEMYGTHVLTNITVGGSYTAYYKSAIIEENSRTEKTKSVGAGAKFNMSKIGLDANGSWKNTEITKSNKKNSNWECYIKSLGGSTSGTTITLSPNQGPTFTINLGAWTSSVDDQHSRLVDVDWNATYPIYELITDPVKKTEIKDAVEKYIDSKRLVVLPIVPLYQYWNEKDHFYSTTYYKDEIEGGWKYEYICCYVLNEKIGEAVPFYQYRNGWYHFYTTNYKPGGEGADGAYKYEYISCYVYNKQVENTMPLYQYIRNWWIHYYDLKYRTDLDGWQYEYISCYAYPKD